VTASGWLRPLVGLLSPPPDARALGDGALGLLAHSRKLLPRTRCDATTKEEEHCVERLRGSGMGISAGELGEEKCRGLACADQNARQPLGAAFAALSNG
jgi:hypothetical protein